MSSSPQPVDTPRRERSHSGRLLLRMPETLHAELASAADRAGVSLNQFITTALAEVVGRPTVPARQGTAKREGAGRAPSRSRWLTVLLAVNLLVVAAAGVLAILLLLSSWRG